MTSLRKPHFNSAGDLYCRYCDQYLSVESYSKTSALTSRKGLSTRCKACRASYYQKNKERAATLHTAWKIENPVRWKELQDEHNKRNKDASYPWFRFNRDRHKGIRTGWVLYRLDFPGGYYYFGSSNQIKTRLSQHKSRLRTCNHSVKMNRMAGSSFEVVILQSNKTQSEVRELELGLIYSALDRDPVLCLNTNRAAPMREVLPGYVYINATDE